MDKWARVRVGLRPTGLVQGSPVEKGLEGTDRLLGTRLRRRRMTSIV